MNYFKNISTIILILAIFCAQISRAQTVEDVKSKISDKQDAISKLQDEISQYQKDIDELGKQKDSLSNTIKSLDISKKKLQANTKITQNKIDVPRLSAQQVHDIVAFLGTLTDGFKP